MNLIAKLEHCQCSDVDICSIARRYTAITVKAQRLSTRKNQSCVIFEWDRELLGESHHPASLTSHSIIHPAKVVKFLHVTYTLPMHLKG